MISRTCFVFVFCGTSGRVEKSWVNGELVVNEGRLCDVQEGDLFRRANAISAEMIKAYGGS